MQFLRNEILGGIRMGFTKVDIPELERNLIYVDKKSLKGQIQVKIDFQNFCPRFARQDAIGSEITGWVCVGCLWTKSCFKSYKS